MGTQCLLYKMIRIIKSLNVYLDAKILNVKYLHPIRINSFYALFLKLKLRLVSEIIKSFINWNSAIRCYDTLKKENNISVSLQTVLNIYNEIRKVIKNYYNILYQSEILGEEDKNRVFSIDESLFLTDKNNNQIRVIVLSIISRKILGWILLIKEMKLY